MKNRFCSIIVLALAALIPMTVFSVAIEPEADHVGQVPCEPDGLRSGVSRCQDASILTYKNSDAIEPGYLYDDQLQDYTAQFQPIDLSAELPDPRVVYAIAEEYYVREAVSKPLRGFRPTTNYARHPRLVSRHPRLLSRHPRGGEGPASPLGWEAVSQLTTSRSRSFDWVPAFAGMTLGGAGMTSGEADMTLGGAGTTLRGAGMTLGEAGMTLGGAGTTLGEKPQLDTTPYYADTVITNSVPDRPYTRTERPLGNGRAVLVKESGVKITLTSKGLQTIHDYDNHRKKTFYRGVPVKPIIDEPYDAEISEFRPFMQDGWFQYRETCSDPYWCDETCVLISYERFDIYVDSTFYYSQPTNTFEDFFDLFEPRYEYIESLTKWSSEKFYGKKLDISVNPTYGCVGGYAIPGESNVLLHEDFSNPDICNYPYYVEGVPYFDNPGELGDQWAYTNMAIHEALHSINPLPLFSRAWLTEGFSQYYGYNVLSEFGDINQETVDYYTYQGSNSYNWEGYVANDYHDTSPWEEDIQSSLGYNITAWILSMLRDNYFLNFEDFFYMMSNNHETLDKARELGGGGYFSRYTDMAVIDMFGRALGKDFETEMRPIFRYDGPSGPGWGVREWLPLDWYADLVPSVESFTPPYPVPTSTIELTVIIYNNGDTDANDVPITFYNGATLLDTQLVSVPADSSAVVTASFSLPLGTHTVTVIVDEENLKVELDDSNNSDSLELTVYADSDSDGIADVVDNCPEVPNPGQEDINGNDIGDACESCCGFWTEGFAGNANCDVEGKRNLADITRLIDNVYISKEALCCPDNGNTDGDEQGKVNLADITRLIDHVYISKAETAACE